jgi:hypothetical protein
MNRPTSSLPRFLDTSPKSSPCWRINTETEGGAEKKNDRLEAQRIGISGSCYDKYLSGYDNMMITWLLKLDRTTFGTQL